MDTKEKTVFTSSFFFTRNSRQQRQLYNKLETLYSLTEHFHNDFSSPLLLQTPLKDKFTLH